MLPRPSGFKGSDLPPGQAWYLGSFFAAEVRARRGIRSSALPEDRMPRLAFSDRSIFVAVPLACSVDRI